MKILMENNTVLCNRFVLASHSAVPGATFIKTALIVGALLLGMWVAHAGEALSPHAVNPWLGPNPPGAVYPEQEDSRQYAVLQYDLAHRAKVNRFSNETYRAEALIAQSDRDPLDVVLRRTTALLEHIAHLPNARSLSAEKTELEALRNQAGAVDVANLAGRRELFDRAVRLRRRIAFANPLLDFSELIVLKRQVASVISHMCDQFYGMAQEPGGGLFVLRDPFGAKPEIRDLLDSARIGNGRLKGEVPSGGPRQRWPKAYDGNVQRSPTEAPTEGGSFATPALSYDGKTVAFAYVECKGSGAHIYHLDHAAKGHFAETRVYHLFSMGTDGAGLRMLADGTWNDFSPCFTPAGRIAFISERRGGYLRCGRNCPTYTLHDMAADGAGIRCLSFHDTNEWAPTIGSDGMILWTRWDYVDRDSMVAHHPWTTTPDGRNARSVHGNYSPRRQRADMETDFQQVPDSHKFAGTAAPHHGQSFGSLILMDPREPDDDRMAPVKRFTPEVGFPESQVGSQSYGTPWPLSEDFTLAAYEPVEVKGVGRPFMFGVYLVDSFGNKELIYRDPDIACMNPIPLRARNVPPVIPEQEAGANASSPSALSEPAKNGTGEATVAVNNVYDSLRPFPGNAKIKTLRIWQILPLPIGCTRISHNTGIQLPESSSINLARAVIGEVPVEEDGSAYFKVPARSQMFFQALDEKGLAVQSMRAGIYFKPGEVVSCMGCHEPKSLAPANGSSAKPKLALLRAPSVPKPDVDGSNPWSYPRLVQPVLNRTCVGCHEKNKDKAPPLDAQLVKRKGTAYMDCATTYYASYLSLAPKFAFTDYGDLWRTVPGKFGARASKLYDMLSKGHHGVKLSDEDMHRITLWLDSVSQFYGVYEKEGGEAQLRGEVARPSLE